MQLTKIEMGIFGLGQTKAFIDDGKAFRNYNQKDGLSYLDISRKKYSC